MKGDRRGRSVGAVVGRSGERPGSESMRDRIVEAEAEEQGPGLDLRMDGDSPPLTSSRNPSAPKTMKKQGKRKKRNHRVRINYFGALDEIMADSYVKQEAAHNIALAFTRMMESNGIEAPFEDERFERAAGNMAMVAMMREMAWLFGLGPEHADRIASHTIDRLFAPSHAHQPKVSK